jgi:hypothetical protein
MYILCSYQQQHCDAFIIATLHPGGIQTHDPLWSRGGRGDHCATPQDRLKTAFPFPDKNARIDRL